jgi:hypothetical protein
VCAPPIVDPDVPEPFQETVVTLDRPGYARLVRETAVRVAADAGGENPFVAEGQILDLERTARRYLARIDAGETQSDRFEFERMFLEATTGHDFRGFYDGHARFQPDAARRIIERAVAAGDFKRFQPGVRYFFGRQIPAYS